MSYGGAIFQRGRVAAASIGNEGAKTTLLVLTHSAMAIVVNNTLDTEVALEFPCGINGVATRSFDLAPGEGLYLTAETCSRIVDAGTIKVYWDSALSTQPASGSIRMTAVK